MKGLKKKIADYLEQIEEANNKLHLYEEKTKTLTIVDKG